jgi:hypothetical protein
MVMETLIQGSCCKIIMGNKNMVKKMLETPCGYGCDFGTKLVSVGKRMPVIFKNKSKPGKLNHSNFSQRSFKIFLQ